MIREKILTTAKDICTKDRQDQYGKPENTFQTIADFWNVYLNSEGWEVELKPHDVAMMMALMKVSRIVKGKVKGDNYIDGAAYLALAAECVIEDQENG